MSTDPHALDRRQVRAAFERAVATYDAHAVLQAEVRGRLLERLELMRITPLRVLDAGCGTGEAIAPLSARYPRAELIALDLAPGMARRAQARRGLWQRLRRGPLTALAGDLEALPLADASIDLVFCNLALQWCSEPDRAFGELARVLRPGGLLLFTSFGPDTLRELRQAWAAVDGAVHVNRFLDLHDVGDALVRAGFREPVMDVEHLTLTYADVRDLMRELKGIGAHNVNAGRPRGLTGRARLAALADAYEPLRRDGRLPASWEVVYGTAWAPAARGPGALVRDGSVGLAALKSELKRTRR